MNPSELVKTMKLMRRNGVIHVYTSIVWNIKEMSILLNTDAGRCIRPLYNVDENSQLLLNKSILERMDKKELSINTRLETINTRFSEFTRIEYAQNESIP